MKLQIKQKAHFTIIYMSYREPEIRQTQFPQTPFVVTSFDSLKLEVTGALTIETSSNRFPPKRTSFD